MFLRPIAERHGLWAGSDGNIYSTLGSRRRQLKAKPRGGNRTRGYLTVNFYADPPPRKHVTRYVHVLVAEAFHGPKPWGYETHHKDNDSWNNRPENLEYLSPEAHREAHQQTITEEDWEAII